MYLSHDSTLGSTFVVAMKACGDAGRWEEALAVMDDMRRDGIPPMETTYTTAVRIPPRRNN